MRNILIGWEMTERNKGERTMRTKDLELRMVWNIQVQHQIDDSRAIQHQRNFYSIHISVSLSRSTVLASLLGTPRQIFWKCFWVMLSMARVQKHRWEMHTREYGGAMWLGCQGVSSCLLPLRGREESCSHLMRCDPTPWLQMAGVGLNFWC